MPCRASTVEVADTGALLRLLRERLDYDAGQGAFFRKAGFTGVAAGARIGSPDSGGKLQAAFLGTRYRVDALVWLWETGDLPSGPLTHIDRNNRNDRFDNLKEGRRQPALDANRAAFQGEVATRFGGAIDATAAEYNGRDEPAAFACLLHGPFIRSPRGLFESSHGCPTCSRGHQLAKVRKSPEEKKATALARWRRQRERERAKPGYRAAIIKRWCQKLRATQPERWAGILKRQAPRQKAWLKTEKGKKGSRLQRQRRRARLKSLASAGVTRAEWDAICAAHTNDAGEVCCKYCKHPCTPTIDHVVPIARGGRHEPSNVVPACGGCNSSKAAHLIHEWPKARRLLLPREIEQLARHTRQHLDTERAQPVEIT